MERDTAQPGGLSPQCPNHTLVALQGALGLKGSEGPPGPPGPAVSTVASTDLFSRLLPQNLVCRQDTGPKGQESRHICPGPLWVQGGPWEEVDGGPWAGSRGDNKPGAHCEGRWRMGGMKARPRGPVMTSEGQGALLCLV